MNLVPQAAKGRLRRAQEEDLPAILKLEKLSFDKNWDYYHFKASLDDVFLVYETDRIIGFLIACCCRVANRAMILRVAVHPDHRGRGIATAMILAAIERLKNMKIGEVELDVDLARPGAMRLYERVGFRVSQLISTDYEDDETFYIMKMDLKET